MQPMHKQPALCVIIYDVVCDKRRTRLYNLLKQYGVPVQKSAFEARLTYRERERMLERAKEIIDIKEDLMTMYVIAASREADIVHFGSSRPDIKMESYIIV